MIQIFPAGSHPSRKAPEATFTGTVWQDPIIDAPDPARIHALRVAFEPGARTAWHWHPYGQTLHVTDGAGLVCMRGEAPRVIRAVTRSGSRRMRNIGMARGRRQPWCILPCRRPRTGRPRPGWNM